MTYPNPHLECPECKQQMLMLKYVGGSKYYDCACCGLVVDFKDKRIQPYVKEWASGSK